MSDQTVPPPLANGLRQRRGGKDPSVDDPQAVFDDEKGNVHLTLPTTKEKHKDTSVLELPEEDRHRSKVAQSWLKSRLNTPLTPSSLSSSVDGGGDETPSSVYRNKGEDRPLTVANIKLALLLAIELWRPFLGLFWHGHRLGITAFLLRRIVRGTLPACRLYSQSRMLDLVQKSFEAGQVDTDEVLWAAASSMLSTASNDIYNFFATQSDAVIQRHIDYTMERSYLDAQLALSIPSMSSPYVSAVMYEAGVFAGFEPRTDRYGMSIMTSGPFGTMNCLFSLVTHIVEIFTQIFLVLRTLSSASKDEFSSSTLILISLALAPSVFRLGGSWLFGRGRGPKRLRAGWHTRRQEMNVKDMVRKGGYKQEVVLFGLRDWVLAKWDDVKLQQIKEQENSRERRGLVELGLGLGQESVKTMFYVLLALRTLSTTLSLGSIRLYQSTANSLLSAVGDVTSACERVFQATFSFAAFYEATCNPDCLELALRRGKSGSDTPLLDYETVREPHGMRIETRNLGFTYPGCTKPVLHDINLNIAPGETLAIVGFNGGGKTTLVKALMGLYDHTGTLLINAQSAELYAPQSLHRRTSCLFQDFSKYSLSLRENVGVGDVKRMDEIDEIHLAIERGGAEKVRETVGMEGLLNRAGVPDVEDGGEGLNSRKKKKASVVKKLNTAAVAKPTSISQLAALFGGKKHEEKQEEEEKKVPLSGGQWQRVALSRAFLRADEADLVIFDEPSASLDPRAEAQLFQRIHGLSTHDGRRTTTIYISHRFSTVRKADRIAVVEDGTIVEIGSHGELMTLGGRYHELFNLQKEGFE